MAELKETFWGDLYGHTKLAWKQALEAESECERDRFAARELYLSFAKTRSARFRAELRPRQWSIAFEDQGFVAEVNQHRVVLEAEPLAEGVELKAEYEKLQ